MQTGDRAGFEPVSTRRLLLAVLVSAGLHGAAIVAVQSGPKVARPAGAPTIAAWIEHTGEARERAALVPHPPAVSPEADPLPPAPTPLAAPETELPLGANATESPLPTPQAAKAASLEPKRGLERPAMRDATYYPVASLDEYPRPLGAVDPCYPQGATGEVALLLLIDDTGVVNEVSVLDAKPDGLFTAGAIQACRDLRFAPGRKDGRAVRSRVRMVLGSQALSAVPSQ